MLNDKMAVANLPVEDLERALTFYVDKLGLKKERDSRWDAMLSAGMGTMVYLYKRAPTKADHTVLTFHVDDIESEMMELKDSGVMFEEYDLPDMGIKTENGIATWEDGSKMAWFKDTEGNILGLAQM